VAEEPKDKHEGVSLFVTEWLLHMVTKTRIGDIGPCRKTFHCNFPDRVNRNSNVTTVEFAGF
jgi:hypothetical protein